MNSESITPEEIRSVLRTTKNRLSELEARMAACGIVDAPAIPSLTLGISRIHPDAVVPVFAHVGDACFDLRAVNLPQPIAMGGRYGFKTFTFETGLVFEVPPGHVMLVFSRSGQGFNHDVRLANSVGVIDSGYRGEVTVKLRCDQDETGQGYSVAAGERIAQALVIPRPDVLFEERATLSETARGTGGYGSTGVK